MFSDQLLATGQASDICHSLNVTTSQHRDDTHIRQAQALNAHKLEVGVDHCALLALAAHLGCAGHVPTARDGVAVVLQQVLVAVRLGRQDLAHRILGVRLAALGELEHLTQTLNRHAPVELVLQEARVEPQRHGRVGRLQRDLAARLRIVQERQEARVVHGLGVSERVPRDEPVDGHVREQLVVRHRGAREVLLLGLGQLGELGGLDDLVGGEEADAHLAGEPGPGARAVASPLLHGLRHGDFGPVEGGPLGATRLALEDHGGEDVVAETLAECGLVEHDGDVVSLELVGWADAGMHEDARVVETACAQDNLLGCQVLLPVGLHADGLLAIQDQALHRCVRHDGQVRAGRAQEVLGGRPKTLVGRGDKYRHTNWVARVVVRVDGPASGLEGIQQRRQVVLPLVGVPDMQRALGTVVLRLRLRVCGKVGVLALVEALQPLEALLHGPPRESLVAHDAGPLIIVVPGADRVHTKVNGAGAAQAKTTRVVELPTRALRLRRRLVAPVY